MRAALAGLILLGGTLLAPAAPAQDAGGGRFVAVDVYLDSDEPVAAWQFRLGNEHGAMRVVGIENGESVAYERTPYYDRDVARRGTADTVIVADYSLADASRLPSGRTRIATLHLMLDGTGEPAFDLELVTAVTEDGEPLDASIGFSIQTGSER